MAHYWCRYGWRWSRRRTAPASGRQENSKRNLIVRIPLECVSRFGFNDRRGLGIVIILAEFIVTAPDDVIRWAGIAGFLQRRFEVFRRHVSGWGKVRLI